MVSKATFLKSAHQHLPHVLVTDFFCLFFWFIFPCSWPCCNPGCGRLKKPVQGLAGKLLGGFLDRWGHTAE